MRPWSKATRNAKDLAAKFPEVAQALGRLKASDAVVDGEIVSLDEGGRSSFQLLQACELGETRPPLMFYAFDLLRLDGRDLRGRPIEDRKETLRKIVLEGDPLLRFSPILRTFRCPIFRAAGEAGQPLGTGADGFRHAALPLAEAGAGGPGEICRVDQ